MSHTLTKNGKIRRATQAASALGLGLALALAGCQTAEKPPRYGPKFQAGKYPTSVINGKRVQLVPASDILMQEEIPAPPAPSPSGTSIIVNTRHQRAWLYQDGAMVDVAATCTGRPGYETPPGTYRVISRHRDWVSTIYKVPMPFFLRLNCMGGMAGLHQGPVALTPSSHGCIRLPSGKAQTFFESTPVGSTVVIEDFPRA